MSFSGTSLLNSTILAHHPVLVIVGEPFIVGVIQGRNFYAVFIINFAGSVPVFEPCAAALTNKITDIATFGAGR